MMRRRDVLLGALGLGGASALAGLGAFNTLARAGDHPDLKDRYFIFCYFPGAWDILVGLDPRNPALFRDDNLRDTMIQPAYDQLAVGFQDQIEITNHRTGGVDFVGPYFGDMVDHMDKAAIVRGMSMETLTHEVGRRRFFTGKAPSGLLARGSSAATWMASMLGQDEAIPNLVGAAETYNEDQPSWASGLRVANVDDLVQALRPGRSALAEEERARVEVLLDTFRDCDHTQRSRTLRSAHELHVSAQNLVAQRLDSLFDFKSRDPGIEALRGHYGINANNLSSPEALGAMAVTAITTGISRAVTIRASQGLDTHFDNWVTDQGPRQMQGWNVIARMIEDLQSQQFKGTSDSWLDHTTILCFSDFSRTPLLNPAGGRDHSLTNACLVAGAGIKPGVYGKSTDIGMSPGGVDLTTGVAEVGGAIARPEHILRALMTDVGISEDLADLRVDPYSAIVKG